MGSIPHRGAKDSMAEDKKETVGSVAVELAAQADNKHTAHDQMTENLSDWEKNVLEAAERGLKKYKSDFFIEVLTKKEPLFENIYRNYFIDKRACPTPQYDQTVYQYIYSADALKYLWTVPDKETCTLMRDNALEIPEEEKQLLNYVMLFLNGDLDRLCKKLNKEPGDTPYLQNLNVVINEG